MKITYISHATLLIEADGLKIATDPWVMGSAYCEQWYLFPKPIAPELIHKADVVLYSHGHEDHLHIESLKTIDKNAKVFYPYSWYPGTPAFFAGLGFSNNKELLNEHTIHLSKHVRVTYLANNLDTVMVIEHGTEVLVNINDALPSASPAMIQHMLAKIKKRWPKIDYVFSSYGSASYFPNTVHYAGKNDEEIGLLRERFFLNNFCTLVDSLSPKVAVPFASDFVLLDDHQRWINKIKFPRHEIAAYFEKQTKATNIHIAAAYPGDVFQDMQHQKRSPYHKDVQEDGLLARVDVDFKAEIAHKKNIQPLPIEDHEDLLSLIKRHILAKQYIIPDATRATLKFGLQVTDAPSNTWLVVDFRQGDVRYNTCDTIPPDLDLHIAIGSKIIRYALEQEWGGDAIIIGYGAEVHIYHEDAVRKELENYCIRLLSRYPNMKEYLPKAPLRGIRYLLSDDIKRSNLLRRFSGKAGNQLEYTDSLLGMRDLWLTKGKCEVCKACNIAYE